MYTMSIAGEQVGGSDEVPVVNPATQEQFATMPDCSELQLEQAMTSARDAQTGWAAEGDDLRRELMHKCAATMDANTEELARILTSEQGKPMMEARWEVEAAAFHLRYFADLDFPKPEVIADDEQARVEVFHRPLGVVAAITPWNFPIALAIWKIAPSIRAGNTVVLKPSPFTPLATLRLGELFQESLPPGVLNVITGTETLGARMTSHAIPSKISFTGSVATGKKVAASAAANLTGATLELGGNDAAIVLDDIDLSAIATDLFWATFFNNGQACSAVKRLFVPEKLHDDFVDAWVAIAAETPVGEGTDESVQLGPVNNANQYDRVRKLITDAVAHGGRAIAPQDQEHEVGYYIPPTIVTGVSEGVALVDEEQFGPVLPILPYSSVDEALSRANATTYGLGGSVWTADPERGAALAARLESGTSWVNTHSQAPPFQPFGGWKWSGLGIENGHWGLGEMTAFKVIHTKKSSTDTEWRPA